MVLSDDAKRAMIAATHEGALAMIDDLQHMREVIAKPEPTPGDIRRLSNPLRRILIDNGGDLRKIAAPRLGRIELLVPDILALIRSGEKRPYAFLSAGVADVFGLSVDAWMVEQGSQPRSVPGFEPGKTVSVRLDGFLSQRIICFNGQWVSRADVIKYVANVAHGVHSGDPKEPNHALLRKIRYIATMRLDGNTPGLSFNPHMIDPEDKPLVIDRGALDFVLIQLISAVRYLTISPDIIQLEETIRQERP
jgi:hypothetical protein